MTRNNRRTEPGTLFRKYFWLANTIDNAGEEGISFNAIQEKWIADGDYNDGLELDKRTFHYHIQAIAVLFGIQVTCNRSTKKYYIDKEDRYDTPVKNWMLDAFQLNETAKKHKKELLGFVSFEDSVRESKYIDTVLSAISQKKCVLLRKVIHTADVDYEKDFLLEPRGLKQFHREWYFIAKRDRLNINEDFDETIEYLIPRYFITKLSDCVSCSISEQDCPIISIVNDNLFFFSDRIGNGPALFKEHPRCETLTFDCSETQLFDKPYVLNSVRENPLHYSQKELEVQSFEANYGLKLTNAKFSIDVVINTEINEIVERYWSAFYLDGPAWFLEYRNQQNENRDTLDDPIVYPPLE